MKAENVTHRYNKFMEAVQHANKTLLPKKSKKMWDDPVNDLRVINSRNVLNTAKDNYHVDPSEDSPMYVDELKEGLQKCYHQVEEEILKSKIQLMENTSRRSKNKESWNLVNDITGRKKVTLVLLRILGWERHFSNLLGQPPQVEDEDITINNMHTLLDIDY